jgi:hypothetical protein
MPFGIVNSLPCDPPQKRMEANRAVALQEASGGVGGLHFGLLQLFLM